MKIIWIPLLASFLTGCINRYSAEITYQRGDEKKTVVFVSTDPAKVMGWMGDQSRENIIKMQVLVSEDWE